MNKLFIKTVEIAKALKPKYQSFREWHVATIWNGNRIKAIGFNSTKTHPKVKQYGYPYAEKCIHAETMAVIRGRLEDYQGHTLIVVRIDNNELVNYSRPCKFCNHLISIINFDNVFFSGHNGECIQLN